MSAELKSRESQESRLSTLKEIHDYYHFEAKTEEGFDRWIHERILETMESLRPQPTGTPDE